MKTKIQKVTNMLNTLLVMFMLIGPLHPTVAGDLAAGEKAMSRGQWAVAVVRFKEAIDSRILTEPGYSMAYWNVHICSMKLGDKDGSAEALLGFIVHTQNHIDWVEKYPVGDKYIKLFKMRERLKIAARLLQTYWVEK